MANIAISAWRSHENATFARVTGASPATKLAIYGIPVAASVAAFKLAGGGLVGVGAAAFAFPVAFIATGLTILQIAGPGDGKA